MSHTIRLLTALILASCWSALIVSRPALAAPTKLSGTMVSGGDVDGYFINVGSFLISNNNTWTVFRADRETDDVFELYSVPTTGGAITKLSGTMATGGDVFSLHTTDTSISPNSSRVVFLADKDTDEVFELYSVPIGGGTVTKLNGSLVASGDVKGFTISPTSFHVVYQADQAVDEKDELYSVPIAGGTPTKLNSTLPSSASDVLDFELTPDGNRVVYIADQTVAGRSEIFSVPTAGGTPITLNDTLASGRDVLGGGALISPNGAWVVYQADRDTFGIFDYFSVPVSGGTVNKLSNFQTFTNSTLELGSQFGPDSARFLYIKDQAADEVRELYSVPVTGGTITKLNHALTTDDVNSFKISPDSSRVVFYTIDSVSTANEGYFSVPTGGGTVIALAGVRVSSFYLGPNYVITPDSSRVVYTNDEDFASRLSLYSIPIVGGIRTTIVQATSTTGVDCWLERLRISPDGSTALYGGNIFTNNIFDIAASPVTGGEAVKLSNTTGTGRAWDRQRFRMTSDNQRVVFAIDQDTAGTIELYSTLLSPPPEVTAIDTVDTNPTIASTIHYSVVFSRSVTGVDAADFTLLTSGTVSGASIGSVTGSDRAWIVAVSTGAGAGTIRLDLVDNDTIVIGSGAPLGGVGAGNGNFSGEVYTLVDNSGNDSDGDGLSDDYENVLGTRSTVFDSDGDGVFDGQELDAGTSPSNPNDSILLPTVYVQLGYTGVQKGTSACPVDSLSRALRMVTWDGTIWFKNGGDLAETPKMSTPITILAAAAAPVIGANAHGSPNVPVDILDTATVNSALTISGAKTIASVKVRLDLTHSFDGDILIQLIAPDATTITLSNQRGDASADYRNVVFDDGAVNAIGNGWGPFTGDYRPESPLSALAGKNAQGTWTLRITDSFQGDAGMLNSWSLEIH